MQEVLQNKDKAILLGNNAIVRGALESGVEFVSTYPGTPASEIGNTFSQIAKQAGVYFEFSTNEKVAMEAGMGASFSGLKTLVAMKNFGVNVAADALLPFVYSGTKGPTVIAVADDPSCHSSAQSEQNSRGFAYMAHIPVLEPADCQECKDFVKLGFEISEKFKIPVMIRLTTRVAHQKAIVKLGKIKKPVTSAGQAKFVKDKKTFVTMPPRVLGMKQELLEKIERVKALAEKSPVNQAAVPPAGGTAKVGIIASGVGYLHAMEALQELKLTLPILKLGFFYPLPEQKIQNFIKNLKKVLVVEELEPFAEKEVARLALKVNPKLEILGSNLVSPIGELRPEQVIQALAKTAGRKYTAPKPLPFKAIKHLPRFCPSCPYWKVFAAVKKAIPAEQQDKVVFGGDIGCYMLAAIPPVDLYDYLFCMGSSVGIAHGVAKATSQKVVAFLGDSTFFHAGIPALINAVYNKSNPLIIVLDNRITAMTGQQPNPGMGKTGMGEPVPEIKIEEIAKACGVQNVAVIDYTENFDKMVATIKEFLQKKQVSVIVARHMCWLAAKRLKKK